MKSRSYCIVVISFFVLSMHAQEQERKMQKNGWYGSKAFPSFSQFKSQVDQLPLLTNSTTVANIKNYLNTQYAIFNQFDNAFLPQLTFEEFFSVFKQFCNVLEKSSMSKADHWLNARITQWHKDKAPLAPSTDAAPMAPSPDFFNPSSDVARQHFVQKLQVPIKSTIILHGDLHGDVHSLVESIAPYMAGNNGFQLITDVYIVFLGDYVDRGLYGLECIYTLMRLKIDNPDRVFMIRGNHEDEIISDKYGFSTELEKKKFTKDQQHIVYRLYSFLPSAIFLGSGTNFIQLCHGGLELGYSPEPLLNAQAPITYEWINQLNRHAMVMRLPERLRDHLLGLQKMYPSEVWFNNALILKPTNTIYGWFGQKEFSVYSGFMWNDFAVDPDQDSAFQEGRGLLLNQDLTQQLLSLASIGKNKLKGVIRAHQHSPQLNDLMKLIIDYGGRDPENKGIAKLWSDSEKKGMHLWDGIVVTFNISPDTIYGIPHPAYGYELPYGDWPGFDYDVTGELTTQDQFGRWTLILKQRKITALQETKKTSEEQKKVAEKKQEKIAPKQEEYVSAWENW